MVLAIVVHELNGLTALSHRITEPVCPDKVKSPLVEPEQIVVPPETAPATVAGITVTVGVPETVAAQLLVSLTEVSV